MAPDAPWRAPPRSWRTVYGGAVAWMVGRWARRVGRAPHDDEIEPHTRAAWEQAAAVSAGDYLLAVEALQRIARRRRTASAPSRVTVPSSAGPPG